MTDNSLYYTEGQRVVWENTYLAFEYHPPSKGHKTSTWSVFNIAGEPLGVVAWFNSWRKYAFYPCQDSVFEQDCLRDMAKFIEDRTQEHRRASHP